MLGRGDSQTIAVVGCGYWGKNLVRNFAELGALRWICDANPAVLAGQTRLYPTVSATTELDEVLADAGVRAVIIAVPAVHHFDSARRAILAGKDIFVEKPLALHYADEVELVNLADQHGVVLMVGHILEYHPCITRLRTAVQSGELGDIWYLYSIRLNLGKVRQEENILWSFAPRDISVITTLMCGCGATSADGDALHAAVRLRYAREPDQTCNSALLDTF